MITRSSAGVENLHNICLLNWQRLSDDCSEAGNLFQSRGPATSNDLSPRQVLDHGMTQVMAPDERRRRLTSGADLHASERYDGAQPCSDLNNSVASLKSTRCRCDVLDSTSIAANLCSAISVVNLFYLFTVIAIYSLFCILVYF